MPARRKKILPEVTTGTTKPGEKAGTHSPPPTLEEIAERAAEIRKEWADGEHNKRAGSEAPVEFEVPFMSTKDIFKNG